MKNIKFLMVIMLTLVIGLVGCTNKASVDEPEIEIPVVEVEEEEEEEEEVAKNIIAGTLMSAELLDLFDITPVGVLTSEKALPARYEGVTEIGSPMKPDLEVVVSLNSDLYLSDSNLKEAIDELFGGNNIETMFLTNNSYEDIFENIKNIGQYLNKTEKADSIIAEMESIEKDILASISGKESPNVLVLFGTPESFMIATPNSYTGSLVEKLGGINVAGDLAQDKPMPYLPFSLETIADLDPDMILRLTHVSPEISKKAFDAEFEKGFWTNLTAVKNGKVYDLDPNHFGVSANLRMMTALGELAEILYD